MIAFLAMKNKPNQVGSWDYQMRTKIEIRIRSHQQNLLFLQFLYHGNLLNLWLNFLNTFNKNFEINLFKQS